MLGWDNMFLADGKVFEVCKLVLLVMLKLHASPLTHQVFTTLILTVHSRDGQNIEYLNLQNSVTK